MARKKQNRGNKALSPADWEHLPDEEILKIRVRDLGLEIGNSPLDEYVRRLYAELDAQGIVFRPQCYLADEWFCPDGVPVIGIPFCLAHPRLKHIEKKMMYEVEGGTPDWCMKLLRHETGHAINYAYGLYKRTRWREVFGRFSSKYSGYYSFLPYSKRYVTHLQDHYAQCHPDEDFAETFAVWLTPRGNWREKYRDWPAVKKLNYVDRLMQTVGRGPPRTVRIATPWSAARMTSTVGGHYERKRKYLGDEFPGYYDNALLKLFTTYHADNGRPAAVFLRERRNAIVSSVAAWTKPRKYDLHQLLQKLVLRCTALDLYMRKDDAETMADVSAFVTAVANKVHYDKTENTVNGK
jgi:hypothetical protein